MEGNEALLYMMLDLVRPEEPPSQTADFTVQSERMNASCCRLGGLEPGNLRASLVSGLSLFPPIRWRHSSF